MDMGKLKEIIYLGESRKYNLRRTLTEGHRLHPGMMRNREASLFDTDIQSY